MVLLHEKEIKCWKGVGGAKLYHNLHYMVIHMKIWQFCCQHSGMVTFCLYFNILMQIRDSIKSSSEFCNRSLWAICSLCVMEGCTVLAIIPCVLSVANYCICIGVPKERKFLIFLLWEHNHIISSAMIKFFSLRANYMAVRNPFCGSQNLI